MKQRAIRVAVFGTILLVCGLLYGWICITTGVAIPCVFRKITGYSCPGCGITSMCLYFLMGDFPRAIKCNPALFFCMFPLAVVIADSLVRYVKTGERKMKRWQNILLYIIIGILLVHGVIRNILPY